MIDSEKSNIIPISLLSWNSSSRVFSIDNSRLTSMSIESSTVFVDTERKKVICMESLLIRNDSTGNSIEFLLDPTKKFNETLQIYEGNTNPGVYIVKDKIISWIYFNQEKNISLKIENK